MSYEEQLAESVRDTLVARVRRRWADVDLGKAALISETADYGDRVILGISVDEAPLKRMALFVHNDQAAWEQSREWSGIYAHGHSLEKIKAHFDSLPVNP